MTAETSVVLEQVENVLAVPYDSIQEKGDGTFYITVADDSGAFPGKPDGNLPEQPVSNGTFGKPAKEGADGKPSMPEGFPGKGKKANESIPTRNITVKKGLETDYYTEVISDELKEGMRVLVPESKDSGDMFFDGDFMMMGPGPDGGF